MSNIQSLFFSAREYLAPVLRESRFAEKGTVTPEEFVAAGDFLVYKFPTWSWSAGEASKAKDYLPKDKQYLVSKGVPCLRRANTLGAGAEEDAEAVVWGGDDEEDWVATHSNRNPEDAGVPNMDDIPDVSDGEADALAAQATGLHIGATSSSSTSTSGTAHHPSASSSNAPPPPSVDSLPDMDDIPDMEDDTVQQQVEDPAAAAEAAQPLAALGGTGPGVVQTPTAAAAGGGGANVVQLRTYDCLITYDKYYQTPRMWLLGYDEHKAPLAPHLVFQDISSDYAQKTVTVESFPHLSGVACATVHPCKHASVMKKVIDRTNASLAAAKRQVSGGADAEASSTTTTTKKRGWISSAKKAASLGGSSTKKEEWTAEDQQEGLRVDQYLVIFLKFMSSIMPTIEVDATASF